MRESDVPIAPICSTPDPSSQLPMLDREEYIEQAHLFRTLGERLAENVPMQELLEHVKQEVLSTTRLPMAIDFLLTELKHIGHDVARRWSGCRTISRRFRRT